MLITLIGDGGADELTGDAFGGELIPGVVAEGGAAGVVQVEDVPALEQHLSLELRPSKQSEHLG
jgi:hypothetical protein